MLRRRLFSNNGRLPNLYKEVAYISSSSGTGQFIDTGYTPVSGDEFYTEFMLINSAQYSCIFSAGTTDTSQVILLLNSSIKAFIQYFTTGDAAQIAFETIASIWSTYSIDSNGNFSLNNITGTKAYNSALSTDSNLYLFKRRNDSSLFSGRIRKFTITNGNTTKMDLVPCYRKTDNKPGMYDLVSGNFLVNAGSGEFIIPN